MLNINFVQEISELSTKIKYEIIYDEISTFGYDTVINKINKSKEIQEHHSRFLSYMKAKSDDKKAMIAMQIIRKKYGKRIDFAKKVYNIIISKNNYPLYIRQCDCVYCILDNPNAGKRRPIKFFVSTIGKEHNILQIVLEGASYSEFDMINESSIPKRAKTLGFVQININSCLDDNNFSIKL